MLPDCRQGGPLCGTAGGGWCYTAVPPPGGAPACTAAWARSGTAAGAPSCTPVAAHSCTPLSPPAVTNQIKLCRFASGKNVIQNICFPFSLGFHFEFESVACECSDLARQGLALLAWLLTALLARLVSADLLRYTAALLPGHRLALLSGLLAGHAGALLPGHAAALLPRHWSALLSSHLLQ